MKRNQFPVIPDHSRSAISEAYEAALYCAAFQRMEEEEMKQFKAQSKSASASSAKRNLYRRLRARRRRSAIVHTLPRIAQTAACLIAVLSIGLGVALASSPAVRKWASGVLHADIYPEGNLFDPKTANLYSGGQPLAGFQSGAAIEDALYLAGGINSDHDIYVQFASGAETVRYRWEDQGERELRELTSAQGQLCALYVRRTEPDFFSNGGDPWTTYGLGAVRFGSESFTIDSLFEFDRSLFFDSDARKPQSFSVGNLCADGERLYFTVEWNYSNDPWNGECYCKLFSLDLSSRQLSEHPLPDYNFMGWNGRFEAFNSQSGPALLALSENATQRTYILRIESDGGLTPVVDIPYMNGTEARAFALSADNTLYYLQEHAIYAAPDCDPARAQRIVLSVQDYGDAALLSDGFLAIVDDMRAQFYDLKAPIGDVSELIVDGTGGDYNVELQFRNSHPDVALASDPGSPYAAAEVEKSYVEAILDGDSLADLWILDMDDAIQLIDAGVWSPIEDEAICAAVQDAWPGLQSAFSVDGALAAVPIYGDTYADVFLKLSMLEEIGYPQTEAPDTWRELLLLIRELSLGENPQSFCLSDLRNRDDTSLPELLLNRMRASYIRSCAARGVEVDFGDPRFAELLTILKSIDFDAFCYAPLTHVEVVDGVEEVYRESTFMSFDFTYLPGVDDTCAARTLKFSDEDPVVSRVFGKVIVLNPATERRALAYEYIHGYLFGEENLDGRLSLYPGMEADAQSHAHYSAEEIEACNRLAGDVMLPFVQPITQAQSDALRQFADGTLTEAELIRTLNESQA